MPKNQTIIIRHDIRGRLRLKIRSLKNNKEAASKVTATLQDLDGLLWTRANPACASLALGYHPEKLERSLLLERVSAAVGESLPPEIASDNAKNRKKHPVRRAFRRFAAISAVLGAAVFRSSVLGLSVGQSLTSPLGVAGLIFSAPLVRSGIEKLKDRRLSLDGFLAAGAIAAITAGEALTAFEILWINSGSELLTAWIAERSRRSIAEILEITSHHTFVLKDGVEVERAVSDVQPGDIVVLHTGEKISVDGVIAEGQAEVNEAPLTGREELESREVGDKVYAGTFVHKGVIQVRAEKVGDATYLARVMRKVQETLENRAPIEGVADQLARTLVRVGFAATAVTFLLTGSAWRAFTVLLVMACPCATVLAASTAISAAISAAAKRRILIKGGRYLEGLGRCDTVCFDKTGTLTTARPVAALILPQGGVEERELLQLACSAEVHNHHPLAQALKEAAARKGLEPIPHAVCVYFMGMGMRAVVEGREILVGNDKLAETFGVSFGDGESEIHRLRDQGYTVLQVYRDTEPIGLLAFASQLRPEAPNVIKRLKSMGVKRFMLVTGDEYGSAKPLADKLGITEVQASIMPEDKARFVELEMRQGRKVLMVGDGINDALALSRADVGAAMGTSGSEVAIEAADIALANDDLEALADVCGLSQQTLRVVRQNFWIATGSNIVGVALGALGLLSPVAAGLVHIGHSLGVLANSSRLLSFSTTNSPDTGAVTGATHGFPNTSQAATLPDRETPHPGQNPSEVQSGRGERPGSEKTDAGQPQIACGC
jgi:cation-transporting P-type ATPase C